MRGLFVTGTDTGVGKTTVTAALAWGLRERGLEVGVMKPVETGVPAGAAWPPDAALLAEAAGAADPRDLVVPAHYPDPLAPWIAARRSGQPVPWDHLLEAAAALAARHPRLLVEGAGGLAVPLDATRTMADLAGALGLPLLVVARAGLGTINHTLLTLDYARARGLAVAGVVFNGFRGSDPAEADNPAAVAELTGVPVLGRLPQLPPGAGRLYARLSAHLDWEALAGPPGPLGERPG
ncbi:ATP-dependent dethiobiotin synthetase BioD [Candidatus Hydrogenisulfobacillus filiaventi]|uniref:ATP-dependent dethiobiotin synthetase BioD n=1 Tax=Candidatus Hydrogenisulfobacillus filiaventi TaxID=2707344 RepID=A0A6F8ZK30_9FIRM|nr:ATP-dependent dethiobiotin synthetase BioD [Candidatus Hydrogenisulfobacillus filiaventi]